MVYTYQGDVRPGVDRGDSAQKISSLPRGLEDGSQPSKMISELQSVTLAIGDDLKSQPLRPESFRIKMEPNSRASRSQKRVQQARNSK